MLPCRSRAIAPPSAAHGDELAQDDFFGGFLQGQALVGHQGGNVVGHTDRMKYSPCPVQETAQVALSA
jgi:hypothetical protein